VVEANSPSPLIVPGTSTPKRSPLARAEPTEAEQPAGEAGEGAC
jgi:hypothetical protein